jgi:hypothetical protein
MARLTSAIHLAISDLRVVDGVGFRDTVEALLPHPSGLLEELVRRKGPVDVAKNHFLVRRFLRDQDSVRLHNLLLQKSG